MVEIQAGGGTAFAPRRVTNVRRVVPLIVLALVAGSVAWWWSGTGARLDPGGNGVSAVTPVDAPIYVGYDLRVHGGSMTIDDVRLAHTPDGLTARFFIADGECPIGTAAHVPDSCDLQPVAGEIVATSTARWLVAQYALTADGAARPGAVVVSFHDGIHRRSTALRQAVCLSTVEATARCTDLSNS